MFDKDKLEFRSIVDSKYVEALYDMMVKEKDINSFLHNIDKETYTAKDFVRMMEGRILTAAAYDGTTGAFIILEPVFANTIGNISYYVFKWARGKYSVGIGKGYLEFMLNNFNTLIGLSPITSRVSIKFNKNIGMREVGIIKNACWMYKEQQYVDGLLTYITNL